MTSFSHLDSLLPNCHPVPTPPLPPRVLDFHSHWIFLIPVVIKPQTYESSLNHLQIIQQIMLVQPPKFLSSCCISSVLPLLPAMQETGLIPGLGRSPGEGKGYPLQYSSLEDSMDCIVHGVTESDSWATFTLVYIMPATSRLDSLSSTTSLPLPMLQLERTCFGFWKTWLFLCKCLSEHCPPEVHPFITFLAFRPQYKHSRSGKHSLKPLLLLEALPTFSSQLCF